MRTMKWIHTPESEKYSETYESDMGRVVRVGPGWWDAWAFLPKIEFVEQVQKNCKSPTESSTVKVGECFKTAATAKSAVQRRYTNHCESH